MFDIIISFYVWLSWMVFDCLQKNLISDHNIQQSNKCKKASISSDVKIYIDNYSLWTLSTFETNGVSLMTLTKI